MKKLLIGVTAAALLTACAVKEWEVSIQAPNGFIQTHDILVAEDGSVFTLAQYSHAYLVSKHSPEGEMLWSRQILGESLEFTWAQVSGEKNLSLNDDGDLVTLINRDGGYQTETPQVTVFGNDSGETIAQWDFGTDRSSPKGGISLAVGFGQFFMQGDYGDPVLSAYLNGELLWESTAIKTARTTLNQALPLVLSNTLVTFDADALYVFSAEGNSVAELGSSVHGLDTLFAVDAQGDQLVLVGSQADALVAVRISGDYQVLQSQLLLSAEQAQGEALVAFDAGNLCVLAPYDDQAEDLAVLASFDSGFAQQWQTEYESDGLAERNYLSAQGEECVLGAMRITLSNVESLVGVYVDGAPDTVISTDSFNLGAVGRDGDAIYQFGYAGDMSVPVSENDTVTLFKHTLN